MDDALMSQERRQFPRLDLTEDAYAVDESGQTLGKVRIVGGGGMQIAAASNLVLDRLPVGRRVRITVIEPSTEDTNAFDVIVRSQRDRSVGVEFVGGGNPQ
jgi:hypothetical protein